MRLQLVNDGCGLQLVNADCGLQNWLMNGLDSNWSMLGADSNWSMIGADTNWSMLVAYSNCSLLVANPNWKTLVADSNCSKLVADSNCWMLVANPNWSMLGKFQLWLYTGRQWSVVAMSNQRSFKIESFRFPAFGPKKIEYIRFWNKILDRNQTFSISTRKFRFKRFCSGPFSIFFETIKSGGGEGGGRAGRF